MCPIQEDQAHAFCTQPCGLPVHSLIHSLLPELGCRPEHAQQVVFHAYRNVLLAAQKQDVAGLALPIIGGDRARGILSIAPFVRAALAAVSQSAHEGLKEVYLCPHTEEALDAIKDVVLDLFKNRHDEDGERQDMFDSVCAGLGVPSPQGPNAAASATSATAS